MAGTVGERDVRVDFEHHGASLGNSGHGVVGTERQREITVLIHGRGHGEDYIGRHQAAVDQHRHFGEVGRMEVHPTLLTARTSHTAKEVSHMANVLDGLRIDIAVLAERQNLRNLDILKAGTDIGQRRQQGGRLADPGRNDDGVAVLDHVNCIGRRHAFLLVFSLYGHSGSPLRLL
ncbi:hypothetical protein SDC9_169023 [bioreactor metagenome]|uniref:Uncharacterized protein n=1 Tax=bioreactor metagenome TaxID=1076179 RepID=A0A645GCQ7_9ZZZZ